MQDNISNPEIATHLFDKLEVDAESRPWFSDKLAVIFQWITFSTMCQAVALFGIGSNIINIICFTKQGFKDPVNISLFGLAVADLASLVTATWTNICLTPAFGAAGLAVQPLEFQHLIAAMPHFTFTRISCWITALITLERCLCIIAPIKVKSIVTSKRVSVIIICVFVILLASVTPIYCIQKLAWKFFPNQNKTLIGVVYVGHVDNVEEIESVATIINNICLPYGAFIVTIVCTILVFQLHKKTQWRKASTVSTQADNVSSRNEKVAKMVVMISGLFIFCFTPICAIFIGIAFVPSISVSGKQKNVIFVFTGIAMLLESVNSAVNIFIYYDMSSKYRVVLRQLLCCRQNKKDKENSRTLLKILERT